MKKIKFSIVLAAFMYAAANVSAQSWSLTGNAGTSTSTNFIGTTDNIAFKIRTNNATRFTISGIGRVGIGISLPVFKLDVKGGSINTDSLYRISGTQVLKRNAQNKIQVGDSLAHIGMGTSVPGNKLHVSESKVGGYVARFENTSDDIFSSSNGIEIVAATGIHVQGTPHEFITFKKLSGAVAGAVNVDNGGSLLYTSVSDSRLKTNITDTKYGLKTILNIEAKDYSFKSDLNSTQTGFIAQQLYEQFPDAVSKGGADPKTNPWMIDYGRLTPALVKAIQEQQQQLDEKDKAIRELQNELTDLKSCVESLRADVLKSNASQKGTVMASAAPPATNLLFQNQPNPFNQTTVIRYALSKEHGNGVIIIRDLNGNTAKSIAISNTGKGQVTVSANELAKGTYTYSLEIAGQSVDTKLMVITQ